MSIESTLRHRLGADDRLIETLGFRPGEGLVRLDRHLNRMSRSAATFSIPFDRRIARAKLEELATGDVHLRVRATLNVEGDFEVSSVAGVAPSVQTTWRIAFARTRIGGDDPLLAHKTTRRSVYEAARAEFGSEIDEVILLNRNAEVCEGTITNIFVSDGDGMLLTPPLSCGLLPGILREELIETGRARPTRLTLDQLLAASDLYVGNSFRGLIRAKLVR
jgi:4-amino-4-deoxychorismate lyase